jgi:hypothetical protein
MLHAGKSSLAQHSYHQTLYSGGCVLVHLPPVAQHAVGNAGILANRPHKSLFALLLLHLFGSKEFDG